jgi:hypothetical protein
MTLTELFDAVRAPYAERLAAAAGGNEGFLEAAFRLADGAVATEGALGLPLRADFIHRSGPTAGQSTMVDATSRPVFEPIEVAVAGRPVTIEPFTWDWALVAVAGLSLDHGGPVLRDWFMRWFDEEDAKAPDASGLQGVVHAMMDPVSVGDGFEVTIDLGSAPGVAVDDLLTRLALAGARSLRLGAPPVDGGGDVGG